MLSTRVLSAIRKVPHHPLSRVPGSELILIPRSAPGARIAVRHRTHTPSHPTPSQNKTPQKGAFCFAERVGFEPTVQLLTVQRFSKPSPSATRASLHQMVSDIQCRTPFVKNRCPSTIVTAEGQGQIPRWGQACIFAYFLNLLLISLRYISICKYASLTPSLCSISSQPCSSLHLYD